MWRVRRTLVEAAVKARLHAAGREGEASSDEDEAAAKVIDKTFENVKAAVTGADFIRGLAFQAAQLQVPVTQRG